MPLYHLVSDGQLPHYRSVRFGNRTPSAFRRDLIDLQSTGRGLSLDEVIACARGDAEPEPDAFFLSIDDGIRECRELMAPILEEVGVPATFFVLPSVLDNKDVFWRHKAFLLVDRIASASDRIDEPRVREAFAAHAVQASTDVKSSVLAIPYRARGLLDDLARILELDFEAFLRDQRPYLTTEDVLALRRDGFSIGAHSVDHPRYLELELDEQLQQTRDSIHAVRRILGECTSFAFPFHDALVSRRFFDELHTDREIRVTFGTSAPYLDEIPTNLQRHFVEAASYGRDDQWTPIWQIAEDWRRRAAALRGSRTLVRPPHPVRVYSAGELAIASASEATRDLPIARNQARAIATNPRGRDNEPALLVMTRQDKVIAHLAFLSGAIASGGQERPVAWAAGPWVDPDVADATVAPSLMTGGIVLYALTDQGRVGVAAITPGRSTTSESFPVTIERTAQVLRVDPGEIEGVAEPTLDFEYVTEIDDATAGLLAGNGHTRQDVAWALRHPWVTGARVIAIKLYDDQRRVTAFVILQALDRIVCVGCAVHARAERDRVAALIALHVRRLRAETLALADADLADAIERALVTAGRTDQSFAVHLGSDLPGNALDPLAPILVPPLAEWLIASAAQASDRE